MADIDGNVETFSEGMAFQGETESSPVQDTFADGVLFQGPRISGDDTLFVTLGVRSVSYTRNFPLPPVG